MIVNILSFLVVVGLLVLFGWLTWRAVRAKRLWVKIVGGLVSGLLTLLLLAITFFAGKGLAVAYISPPPVREITVEGTPEQIARGEYLANIACVGCHGANGDEEFPLSGGFDLGGEIPLPLGSIVAANITPGGLLAELSDGEVFRVLRNGYGPDGALAAMGILPYKQLSDEDIKALIAFLRSQQPVTTESNGGDKLNLLALTLFMGLEIIPRSETPEGVVTAPPAGANAEYGRYVATFGECRGCHGPDMTGTEATAISEEVPNPRPLVGTLTPEQFKQMMRSGFRPDGSELDMPWENASKMNDEDLGALYAFLTTAP